MKKILIIIALFFVISINSFASMPEFDNGTVIDLTNYSEKFRDKIILINCSSLDVIDIEFSMYKNSNWVSLGKITDCRLGKEVNLKTKEKFENINFIGYKVSLSSNIKIVTDVRHHDLRLYLVEKSNVFFGTNKDFSKIQESPLNGIYKIDTSGERRNYEDNVCVQNAPKGIIMFKSPEYGNWDVYATFSGNSANSFYNGDIDDYSPYWIIQVFDEHKYYIISAFAKDDDLIFSFQKTDKIEYDNSSISDSDVETRLKKLKQLYEKGLIDESEYKSSRLKILGI